VGDALRGNVGAPAYDPVTDGLAVLRRMGSGTTHLAAVDPLWFENTKWLGPPYWALHQPAVTLCRAVLRPGHRGLVAMQPGTKVGCRVCKRLAPPVSGATNEGADDGAS